MLLDFVAELTFNQSYYLLLLSILFIGYLTFVSLEMASDLNFGH